MKVSDPKCGYTTKQTTQPHGSELENSAFVALTDSCSNITITDLTMHTENQGVSKAFDLLFGSPEEAQWQHKVYILSLLHVVSVENSL